MTTEVTERELLDRAAGKLDGAFEEQPIVGASVRGAVADTYFTLGSYEEAAQGEAAEAESLYRRVLAREDLTPPWGSPRLARVADPMYIGKFEGRETSFCSITTESKWKLRS